MNKTNPWYSDERRRPHHRLKVWKSAKALSVALYRVTATFPDDERFGLISQLRRAGVSVASNIAEGAARSSDSDFLRFLYVARGSLNEIDTQLEISGELEFLNRENAEKLPRLFDDTSGNLQELINRLEQDTRQE